MTIKEQILYNTFEYESNPMIKKGGFREYDGRWIIEKEINFLGFQCLGAAIATQAQLHGHKPPQFVIGHDYRSYSASVKYALINGLLSAGAEVCDIGLAITPMAYFAQYYLKIPCLVMITASHNENGWTGVKVGFNYSETHGPDLMSELRDIVYSQRNVTSSGKYQFYQGIRDAYIDDLVKGKKIKKALSVVVNTGNGTCGVFSPQIIERLGCRVISLNTNLDWTFPNYNPNPENIRFLESIKNAVHQNHADIGFGFDGDGDRIGVVDDEGDELFSDKFGLLITRYLTNQYSNFHIIVDVKSTILFELDPVLKAKGVTTEYWITGHSYIKDRVRKTNALGGYEKSGHFFFSPPIGRGYDDSNLAAVLTIEMLDKTNRALSSLKNELQTTWQSPTMEPYCPDDRKYQVISELQEMYENEMINKIPVAGHLIHSINKINGVRVEYDDTTWSLVRASSNKPALVVVIESMTDKKRLYEVFDDINRRFKIVGGIGDYDQVLPPLGKI